MFNRILVANRGEIAIRIIRACMEMNIESVAVYSTADKESLHVKLATKSICIGGGRAADSYLNMDAIITAAQVTGCDALHPGFGFLSENSEFVRKCEAAGITFIGPTADAMDALGNKSTARKMMMKAGVPVVPGSEGPVEDFKKLEKIAKKIGYPVLIKASAGGGGRGMRRVYHPEDLQKLYEEAKAETRACFNDDEMYVEKLVLNPRHIEFQILADEYGNVIHLGERDCSIQRKNQKLIEESPCMFIDEDLRKSMGKAAVLAAKAAGYTNAGTVEFVLDEKNHYYFIEMNTRIQVEHGVTEAVTGIDLIKWQIRIAFGEPLNLKQKDVRLKGHAIECRINAEDPSKGFMANTGKITFLNIPGGPGVRVDTLLYNGYETSPFYDSMMAKIIVHAQTRLEAIRRMRRALLELVTEGIITNGDFDYLLLHHPDFVKGNYNVGFIEEHIDEILAWDKAVDE
ncbi:MULTISPECIES: acetyl-CoA carboxylase biotin carboxylase subunit [Pseudobutyrivibrio]|uniref:Biotin carboxylase n=1 Tax=Pseudobutyrivibrio xylanivorans TaxID=185007 RepID=A0A1G5S0P2_PSEXY|nr:MULTISPECIES: acetyl-CoA carboxylase biotin carboxylase subunit [Pseudobutyrivibrio]MDC7280228.1 acetyl-CoA carboxylase biotin carboxylase subunit [Butyrivibrio fibrisolvens]SCZ79119.1 acetyl-CoA carboxylase, biotin carboxylase subunit [Pseudobutyrivibrio xylanivorans]